MIGISSVPQSTSQTEGLRPINLRTDLAQLTDLIELVFRETMDENGRAAIREMRYLSQMGWGLRLLSGLGDSSLGLGLGYVWIEDNRLIGNASLFAANWPRELGRAWLIANVGTHPDYRRRGIARQLMLACLKWIESRGGDYAILQVDYDNEKAIELYEDLGFVKERAFTLWSRSALVTAPPPPQDSQIFITQPRSSEWQKLYHLAEIERPNERGGLGWLKPVHEAAFRPSFMKSLTSLFSLGSEERLIVRDENEEILAYLELERSLVSRNRVSLIRQSGDKVDYTAALLSNILRRYRSTGFLLEHPRDDIALNELLLEYRFRPQRTIWHMRYSFD